MNEAIATRSNLMDLANSCHKRCYELRDALEGLDIVLRVLDFPDDKKELSFPPPPEGTLPCLMGELHRLNTRLNAITERAHGLRAKFEVAVGEPPDRTAAPPPQGGSIFIRSPTPVMPPERL